MYVSVRDYMARETANALGKGTSMAAAVAYLGLNAMELEYFPDDKVYLLEPRDEQDKALLSVDKKAYPLDKIQLTDKKGRRLLVGQLKKHNMRISCLLMHNNFGDPDMKKQVEWILRCVDAAEHFNVRVIRIDPIIHVQREISIEEAARMSINALREVFGNMPGNKKIYLAMENHGQHGNDPEFIRKMIGEVGDERLGLTLDSGNFYWFGFPLEQVYNIFKEFAGLTRHTHIKNIKYPEDIRTVKREMGYKYGTYVSPIYEGDIDHRKFVTELKKANYTEDLCIEDESLSKYPPKQILEIMKKSAEYLKNLI
jgi:sugar phosphate isomerase/epimerase